MLLVFFFYESQCFEVDGVDPIKKKKSKNFQGFIQTILMSAVRYKKLSLTVEFWNSSYMFLFLYLFVVFA